MAPTELNRYTLRLIEDCFTRLRMNADEERIEPFYFPPADSLATRNFHLFLTDYFSTIDLFYFTLTLAQRADRASVAASEALLHLSRDDAEREKYKSALDQKDAAFKRLQNFGFINSRNISVNIVDAFLWYISSILQSAMRRKPEIVKSGESIRIEDIFDFQNRREMINYLIDRKVNSLSYGGMSKIEKFIYDSLGIRLFDNDSDRSLMQIFIEIKNIHVHNRGYVNRIFLSRIEDNSNFSFREGDRVHLIYDQLVLLSKVCVETARRLDSEIAVKFKLTRKRISTWRGKQQKSQRSMDSSLTQS